MSSTSVKHRNFVAEPMGEKEVTELAGVGPVYAKRLRDLGYDKAYVVLGQFLVLKKNEELFIEWLKMNAEMGTHHATAVFECLNEWANSFL